MSISLADPAPNARPLVLRRDRAPPRKAPLDDLYEQLQADLAALLASLDLGRADAALPALRSSECE